MTQTVTPQAALDRFLSRFETPVRLMAAVSGGSDSIGLLFLLHQALATGRYPGFSLCAATVDHALRAESADEALAVARLCGELGIAHRIAVWEGAKPRTGLAAAAREARYALLCRMSEAFGADAILSAHTADDQIETVTMRAERNASMGARGLAGMAPAALLERRHWLLRPFLECRRADIRQTLQAHGIGWCDDPSNENIDYERPRMRARIAAGEEGVGLTEISAAQRRRSALADSAAAFVRSAVTVHGGAVIAVERAAMDALDDDAVLSCALACLVAVAGGMAHPLSEERMQPVLGLCRTGERTRLNAGRVLFDQRRDRLFMMRERRELSPLSIAGGSAQVWDGRYRIVNRGEHEITVEAAGREGEERAAELFPGLPPGVAKAAAAALPFCRAGAWQAVLRPDNVAPGMRFENFLAPFDRILPWFDVTLASEIAARFGRDGYGLPFRAILKENEG